VNRVKDLYEIIVKYYSIPPMARYIISTNFLMTRWEDFILNEDEMSDKIFQRAIEKKVFPEFSQIVRNYKSNGNDSK